MNQVVAHCVDGRLLKGTTNDFLPNKDLFHLVPADGPIGTKPIELRFSDLKALFFVKSYKGDSTHKKVNEFRPNAQVMGRKIQVTFKDGEVMSGTTQGYQPGRPGFFVVPVDTGSNNQRCFVISAATSDVKLL